MGVIFLSGGGDKKHSEKFDAQLMRELDRKKPLLYLPIAMEGAVSYTDCEKWITSVFEPLGFLDIDMWSSLQNRTLDDLWKFSAMYIGGGNTFLLLDKIRRSGFDGVLKNFIDMGGIVYGGSAGAIILGEDIRTCVHLDENQIGLSEFRGLKRLQGHSVWCHYRSKDDSLIEQYIQDHGFPVLALSEETGVVFENGRITVTGTSPAYIFSNRGKEDVGGGFKLG